MKIITTRVGRRALFATVWLVAWGGCASDDPRGAPSSASAETIAELSVDEVDARITKKDGRFFVFDVNPKEVFDAGHVPTATWIEEVQASLLPAD